MPSVLIGSAASLQPLSCSLSVPSTSFVTFHAIIPRMSMRLIRRELQPRNFTRSKTGVCSILEQCADHVTRADLASDGKTRFNKTAAKVPTTIPSVAMILMEGEIASNTKAGAKLANMLRPTDFAISRTFRCRSTVVERILIPTTHIMPNINNNVPPRTKSGTTPTTAPSFGKDARTIRIAPVSYSSSPLHRRADVSQK